MESTNDLISASFSYSAMDADSMREVRQYTVAFSVRVSDYGEKWDQDADSEPEDRIKACGLDMKIAWGATIREAILRLLLLEAGAEET